MSRLLQVGEKFKARYKIVDGPYFYGQVLQPPDTSRVTNFLSARRYLRVTPKSIVAPRQVVIIDNQKYIVAEHGTGFYVHPIYKHFKLFEVDSIEEWRPAQVLNDPVTGIQTTVREEDGGTPDVYLSIQPHTNSEDSLRIPLENRTAICNQAVSVEDQIGDYLVTKVDTLLGISIVEMKKI